MLDAFMGNTATGIAGPRRPKKDEVRADRKSQLGRRAGTTNLRLRELSQRHLDIISLHLTGNYTGDEIGEIVGCTTQHVYAILNDPLTQNVIEQFRAGQLADLEALMPKAIRAVRDGLNDGNVRTKLLAVDRYQKLRGAEEGRGYNNTSVSVTIVDARSRFVDAIKKISPEAIDGRKSTPPSEDFLEASYSETSS